MGKCLNPYSILAYIVANRFALLATCTELGGKQVASYASESTGMDISVEHVQLVFPLKLGVEGVKVLQPVDSLKNSRNLTLRNKKDTVADIQKMVVDVQLLPLFSNQVMVDELNSPG